MKIRVAFFILLITSGMFSCSSGHDKQKTTDAEAKDSVVMKENFEVGKIIEKVVCKKDTTQSYAMYLPTNYSPNGTFPIIIAFDAHGTGKLPVSLYKDLAEKFGYIIVGSNNSKNGVSQDESKQIAGKLFDDVGTRLAVNMQRIYLLGFSGGARIANAITMDNGSIAGVICCGAVAPTFNNKDHRSDYTLMGIIGNEDFNYVEMRKYDMVDIAGYNIKHAVLTFEGKHEWPSKDIMREAFWWLELNEMRRDKVYRTDAAMTEVKNEFKAKTEQLQLYNQTKQLMKAYELCRTTINFYDGLVDLTYFYSTFAELQKDKDVDWGLRKEEISWQKEEELRAKYIQAIQKENYVWWQKDIADLNKKIKNEKNKEDVLVYKRTLNYLSLLVYMQTGPALEQNNMGAFEYFCKLYMLVDPTNTEAHYLMATLFAKQGKQKEAINSLNNAIKYGFKDIARWQNDKAFSEIKNTKGFEEVLEKIKQ